MSRLKQLATKVADVKWVKPEQISDTQIVFSVVSITESTSDYGPQWNLQLVPRMDTVVGDYDMSAYATGKVLMSLSKSTGRDELIEAMRENLPYHNCVLINRPLRGNRTFYALEDLEETDPRYEETEGEIGHNGGGEPPMVKSSPKSGSSSGSKNSRRKPTVDELLMAELDDELE